MQTLEETKTATLTPFLKWAGGKTWLAPRLAAMYAPYRDTHTWVEPFCGALGATFGVMPKRAILSDVNEHLLNLYDQITIGLKNDYFFENSQEYFNLIKKDFNLSLNPKSGWTSTPKWKALAFYYLNRTCFNGLCRFNRKGEFNVGYGKHKNPILDHDFSLYQRVFESWDFWNSCYVDTLTSIKYRPFDNHFIYADPPYDDGFTGYSGTFTWDDQVDLASSLAALNHPVVASNKATDRIIDLHQGLGFDIEIIQAPRRISCKGDRTAVDEILATINLR